MSTIRFEDLGPPVQKLLKALKSGYTEDDMSLMEFVSVKDMAQIYNDMASERKAELIWQELRAKLQKRKEEQAMKNAELSEKKKKAEERAAELERQQKEEEEREAQEEAERAAEEERKRKERKRKKKEAARLAQEEEEQRRREEEEAEAAQLAAEEKERKKEERRKRREERERLLREQQEEEERLLAEQQAEEERQAEERRRKKEEKRRRREEEAQRLQEEQQKLEAEARAVKAPKRKQKEEWEKHVKDHPLEFGGDMETEVIKQVKVERETRAPPKEFLKVKAVRIPSHEEKEETTFYNVEVYPHHGERTLVARRYNQFVDLRSKIGGTLENVDQAFPGKTLFKVKGEALDKRRRDLEEWINQVIDKLEYTRSYAGVQLDSKQQLRGDAARAEAERQRMQQAAVARAALHTFCGMSE